MFSTSSAHPFCQGGASLEGLAFKALLKNMPILSVPGKASSKKSKYLLSRHLVGSILAMLLQKQCLALAPFCQGGIVFFLPAFVKHILTAVSKAHPWEPMPVALSNAFPAVSSGYGLQPVCVLGSSLKKLPLWVCICHSFHRFLWCKSLAQASVHW